MARGGRSGDADDGSPSGGRPGRPHGGSDSVAGAQEAVAAEARQGRPSGGTGSTAEPGALTATGPGTTSAQSFVDDLTGDPRSVSGRSAQDLADLFNAAGYPATVEQSRKRGTSGNAVQVRIQGHPEITNIQVHPGGGRHTPEGSPYWKISTSTDGKTWVIPRDFRGAEELGGNVVRYDE